MPFQETSAASIVQAGPIGWATMSSTRWITEMGMGVDVHGGDYTRAGRRAVSDALRHSSLNFFDAVGKSRNDMAVEVQIAVQRPDRVDIEAIAGEVPYGTVTVKPMTGGLDVPAHTTRTSW